LGQEVRIIGFPDLPLMKSNGWRSWHGSFLRATSPRDGSRPLAIAARTRTLGGAGPWRKLAALRHARYALLAISLVKLFAVNVWDFGEFTRVAAFLALGVALVVLGFFYNRFAEVLKKILEGDGE